jgi:hypothetical protein
MAAAGQSRHTVLSSTASTPGQTPNPAGRQTKTLNNFGPSPRDNHTGRTAWRAARGGRNPVLLFARLVHDLRLVLVEIETGVKLGLPREEIFQAGFVLERAAQLGTVIRQALHLPLDFVVFVIGAAIEAAEGVLDARDRSQRIIGVEIGLVGLVAADEEVGLAVSGSRSL